MSFSVMQITTLCHFAGLDERTRGTVGKQSGSGGGEEGIWVYCCAPRLWDAGSDLEPLSGVEIRGSNDAVALTVFSLKGKYHLTYAKVADELFHGLSACTHSLFHVSWEVLSTFSVNISTDALLPFLKMINYCGRVWTWISIGESSHLKLDLAAKITRGIIWPDISCYRPSQCLCSRSLSTGTNPSALRTNPDSLSLTGHLTNGNNGTSCKSTYI